MRRAEDTARLTKAFGAQRIVAQAVFDGDLGQFALGCARRDAEKVSEAINRAGGHWDGGGFIALQTILEYRLAVRKLTSAQGKWDKVAELAGGDFVAMQMAFERSVGIERAKHKAIEELYRMEYRYPIPENLPGFPQQRRPY